MDLVLAARSFFYLQISNQSKREPGLSIIAHAQLTISKISVSGCPREKGVCSMEIKKELRKTGSERPGLGTGTLMVALLTASLISVFYLGWKVAGLPFVPFDFFDWMARVLPGQVLDAGIGAMVAVIRALN